MDPDSSLSQNNFSSALNANAIPFSPRKEKDPYTVLKGLKANNTDRPIVAHININFLEKKFKPLEKIIKDNVDI